MEKLSKYILSILLICFSIVLNAQSIERSVVCTDGDYISSGSISLEYTIGETAIGHFTNSSMTLSQGFNQSDTTTMNISIKENATISFLELFPNPASDNLFVTSSHLGSFKIMDATGRILLENIACSPLKQVNVDVSKLTAGVYFLIFNGKNGVSTQRWVKE